MLVAATGKTFLKTTLSIFDQTYHFFDPKAASKMLAFGSSARLVALLLVRFAICTLHAPLQLQPVARPVPPSSKNDCIQHTYMFCEFRTPSIVFVIFLLLLYTLFFDYSPICMILENYIINAKSCQKPPLRHSNHTDYTHFVASYAFGICKIDRKYIFSFYGASMEAPFAIALILDAIFTFSQCFRHHLSEKWTQL